MNSNSTKSSIKKENKKTLKPLIITIIILIALALVYSLLNFSIQLYLYETPTIEISPIQTHFNIKNNESQTINYHINTKTNYFCSPQCEYAYIDRSDSSKLFSGNITFSKKNSAEINITIQGPKKGSGENVYNLELTCKNKATFLCPQSEKSIKKSAFTILSYDLTDKEKEIQENMRTPLLNYLQTLNQIDEQINQINQILNQTPQYLETNQTKNQIEIQTKQQQLLNQKAILLTQLWTNQQYSELEKINITENQEIANNLLENLNLTQTQTQNKITLQNETITTYNQIILQYQNQTNNSQILLNSQLITEQLNQTNNQIQTEIKTIDYNYTTKQYNTIKQFQNTTKNINQTLQNFTNDLNTLNENLSTTKNQLLNIETQKRCNINYCPTQEQTPQNFCEQANNYLTNQSMQIYTIPENQIINYQNNYYNYTGEIITCQNENETCIIDNLTQENYTYLNETTYELNLNQITIKPNEQLQYYYNQLCVQKNITQKNYLLIENLNLSQTTYNQENQPFETQLIEHQPQCCLEGICTDCCLNHECKQNPQTYPLLLIHGHSFLKSSPAETQIDLLNKLEFQLVQDNYIDAGTLDFQNLTTQKSQWSYFNSPIVVKASYYYDNYYNLGSYVYITKKNDNIDTYAIRLSEIINEIKLRTDKPKINIVAHSMGGLVVRRYIQIFGTDSIDTIILIATPNSGIEDKISFLCPVFGENPECDDMKIDSILLKKLNDPNNIPQNIKIYTISGSGCPTSNQDGDGIVTLNSSKLPYATSYTLNGTCDDFLKTSLHSELLDIDKYPQTYEIIKEILKIQNK